MFQKEKLNLTHQQRKELGKNADTIEKIWYVVQSFEQKHGYCDLTNEDLAKELKISLASVKRCLQKAINQKLIIKSKTNQTDRKLFTGYPQNNNDILTREQILEAEIEKLLAENKLLKEKIKELTL